MEVETVTDTLVVNLYGGPGAGKSTMCAQVFAHLKQHEVDCEMVREYAKDKVWEGSSHVLHDQIYVFGKQLHRLNSLLGKVDVIVTDSPLLLSLIYGQHMSESFKGLVKEEYNRCRNFDVYVKRVKPYNPNGRVQTTDELPELDLRILTMLGENTKKTLHVPGNLDGGLHLLKDIEDILENG